MKTLLTHLLPLLTLALCLTACSEDEIKVNNLPHAGGSRNIVADGFEVSTSNPTLLNNWENINTIYIPNNNNILQHITAPWSNNGPMTTLDEHFRKDIKKEDGWTMLFHTFKDALSDQGQSYMVFYNLFTGVLKVFYYSDAIDGTNTQWFLKSDKDKNGNTPKHKMFYVPTYLSKADNDAIGEYMDTGLMTSNQINNKNTGLAYGWNGFEYKVAQYCYNDNLNHDFLISAQNNTIFNGQFDGYMSGNISGKIKSVTIPETKGNNKASDLRNFIANMGGSAAEGYVKDLLENSKSDSNSRGAISDGKLLGTLKTLAGQVANKGISALLKKGLGALFGQTSTVTVYNTVSDVNVTANDTITLKGALGSTSASQVKPIAFNLGAILDGKPNASPANNLVYKSQSASTGAKLSDLGVWCVKHTPVVHFDLLKPFYASETNVLNSNENLEVRGSCTFPTVHYDNIEIEFNPAIRQYITSYTVDKKYFFAKIAGHAYSYGSFCANPNEQKDKIYIGKDRELFDEPEWGYMDRFSVLCGMSSNEANLDTEYYFKWGLPTNSEMLVLVTVSMDINYMGKQQNITESRIFEVKAYEQLSTIRHNPPYTIILSNNGGNWAYH